MRIHCVRTARTTLSMVGCTRHCKVISSGKMYARTRLAPGVCVSTAKGILYAHIDTLAFGRTLQFEYTLASSLIVYACYILIAYMSSYTTARRVVVRNHSPIQRASSAYMQNTRPISFVEIAEMNCARLIRCIYMYVNVWCTVVRNVCTHRQRTVARACVQTCNATLLASACVCVVCDASRSRIN